MSQIKVQFMREAGFHSSYPLWRTQFVFVSTLVLMKFSKLISFGMDELHTVGKLQFENEMFWQPHANNRDFLL
jgi:hypothetical protein